MNPRNLLIASVVLLGLAAGAWWFLAGRSLEIRIPEAELQRAIASRFPLAQTHYMVLELNLEQPRLALREDSGRIALGIDARLNLRLGRQREPLGASIDLETGLRYVAGEGQFFLDQPVVTALDVGGVPSDWSERARGVLTVAATGALTRAPVYTLKPSDQRQAAAKMVLREVRVEGKDLVVRLGL
jgi:hypothetical protein